MNWILEHMQVLIAIAAAIAYMINRGHAARQEAEKDADTPAAREQAERTRRLQEEIRRKILERRGGEVAPVDPFGGPLRRIARQLEEAAAAARQAEAPPPPPLDPPLTTVLERQQRLAEQMQALEAARETERRRAADITRRRAGPATRTALPMRGASARTALLADLRGPHGLRRAVVLREILGPPGGLSESKF
jgi:hypothetical protein